MSGKDVCSLPNEMSKLDRWTMTNLFYELEGLSDNIFVMDYHDELCEENCSYMKDNEIIMTDYNHITKEASLDLEEYWIKSISKITK